MSQSSSFPSSTGSSSSSSMVGNKAPQSNSKMTKNYRNRNLDYPSYGQAYPLPPPFFPPMQVFIIIVLLCYWFWSIIMIRILFLRGYSNNTWHFRGEGSAKMSHDNFNW
jgi:hypothetical protein